MAELKEPGELEPTFILNPDEAAWVVFYVRYTDDVTDVLYAPEAAREDMRFFLQKSVNVDSYVWKHEAPGLPTTVSHWDGRVWSHIQVTPG